MAIPPRCVSPWRAGAPEVPWGWEGSRGGTSPGATSLPPLFIVPSWLVGAGVGTGSDKGREGTAPVPALRQVISPLAGPLLR